MVSKDNQPNYWQVASSGKGRSFSKEFLNYGVMLIGSGALGDFKKYKTKYEKEDQKNYQIIRRFVEDVKKDDIVILKKGLHEIPAVGKVTGKKYKFFPEFNTVEGFWLQHGWEVKWFLPQQKYRKIQLAINRFSGLNKSYLQNIANEIIDNGKLIKTEKIPKVEKIKWSEVVKPLKKMNTKVSVRFFNQLDKLITFYDNTDQTVSEHEMRTFIVIPLLKKLGWDEKRIKIEWNHIDIALFKNGWWKKNSEPEIIIEAKELWHGLDTESEDQAKNYAKKYKKCKKIVLTDGNVWKLYLKKNTQWNLYAYMDIWVPTNRYFKDVKGATDLLLQIMGNRNGCR
ncbi:MAG: hypothetical protein WC947_07680 [Elusimicrobiota bacterium]